MTQLDKGHFRFPWKILNKISQSSKSILLVILTSVLSNVQKSTIFRNSFHNTLNFMVERGVMQAGLRCSKKLNENVLYVL